MNDAINAAHRRLEVHCGRRHWLAGAAATAWLVARRASGDDLPLPKHINAATLRSVEKGLKRLGAMQSDNGSFEAFRDGSTYPVAMTSLAGLAFLAGGSTSTRGPHSEFIRRAAGYTLAQARGNGLVADPRESGYSMYGHGFALLFLATLYGMETRPDVRRRIAEVVTAAISLTSRAQSNLGGWIYTPGGGDEGSVTVTQMQGLRAAHNAGFTVPKSTVSRAIRYLEACRTSEGGIRYSYASGGDSRPPISAAAVTCLYSAGEYESPLAKACLEYVHKLFQANKQLGTLGQGHDYYGNLYAAQAFYQAGDSYWDEYFPPIRDELLKAQQANGGWQGDGVGEVFGTSIALIILQLPFKFLPIYQR